MTEAINKLNTELRTKAKNDLKKGLFKLMNNSVFGKTMEKVINHRDLEFVTTEKKKLFITGTKLSHNKTVFRKYTSNTNEVSQY